jgi:hypothetical protein
MATAALKAIDAACPTPISSSANFNPDEARDILTLEIAMPDQRHPDALPLMRLAEQEIARIATEVGPQEAAQAAVMTAVRSLVTDAGQGLINLQIVLCDTLDREALFEARANFGAVKLRQPGHGRRSRLDTVDQKAGHAVVDDFRRRAGAESDDRPSAGQRWAGKDAMSEGHWQLEGNTAELFQRYLVPAITSKWAEDLVRRAQLRTGELARLMQRFDEFAHGWAGFG